LCIQLLKLFSIIQPRMCLFNVCVCNDYSYCELLSYSFNLFNVVIPFYSMIDIHDDIRFIPFNVSMQYDRIIESFHSCLLILILMCPLMPSYSNSINFCWRYIRLPLFVDSIQSIRLFDRCYSIASINYSSVYCISNVCVKYSLSISIILSQYW